MMTLISAEQQLLPNWMQIYLQHWACSFQLRNIMTHVDVSVDQFLLVEDMVIHEPTGAWWKARPNDAELSSMYMGQLGAALNDGDEYDSRKVQELALAMLRDRLSFK